jgi:hypothetical protein
VAGDRLALVEHVTSKLGVSERLACRVLERVELQS